jgi:hypothetical protein
MTEGDRFRRCLPVGGFGGRPLRRVAALMPAKSGTVSAHMFANDGGYGRSSGRSLPVAPLRYRPHHGFAC